MNSTPRWFPGDERPPVIEVLTFRFPINPAIREFDEVIARFDLNLPRRQWSAKIAIVKFRCCHVSFSQTLSRQICSGVSARIAESLKKAR